MDQFIPKFLNIIGGVVEPGFGQFETLNNQHKHFNSAFVVKITNGVCVLVAF